MSNTEYGEIVIRNEEKTIEFIKSNWNDMIGRQYVCWLEQVLGKLKQIERQREVVRLKAAKIALLCEQITSTSNPPKVLKKTR